MASKLLILILAVLCTEFTQTSAEVKRGIFDFGGILGNLKNATDAIFSKFLPGIGNGFSQAQGIFNNITHQAQAVVDGALQPVKAVAGKVIQQIEAVLQNSIQYTANTTKCIIAQKSDAENITSDTVKSISTCTQTALQASKKTFSDMGTINDEAQKLAGQIWNDNIACLGTGFPNIGGCLLNVTGFATSRLTLLASSQAQLFGELGKDAVTLPITFATCESENIAKATTRAGVILSNVGLCMKNNAQNS